MGIENLNPKILREISSERVEYLVQERKRLEIIQKQKDEEKRIEDTKRNFAGTNIVETLEEIRDKKILIDTQKKIIVPQKGFFRGSYTLHEKMEIHPMVISYNLDSVTARFDNSKSITISQKNNPYIPTKPILLVSLYANPLSSIKNPIYGTNLG